MALFSMCVYIHVANQKRFFFLDFLLYRFTLLLSGPRHSVAGLFGNRSDREIHYYTLLGIQYCR